MKVFKRMSLQYIICYFFLFHLSLTERSGFHLCMWWLSGVHIYFPSHKQNTLFLHHWFGAVYFYNYHGLSSHFRPKPHGGVEDHSPFCYHPCCIIIVFYGPERTTMLCEALDLVFSSIQMLSLNMHMVPFQTSCLGLSAAFSLMPVQDSPRHFCFSRSWSFL